MMAGEVLQELESLEGSRGQGSSQRQGGRAGAAGSSGVTRRREARMSQLSVKDHLEGILSDFEALKRSFDVEDAEEGPGFSPSSLFSPSPPAAILAAGNGESRRLASPMQPTYQSRISISSSPSPAHSPVLKTRISSSLSFNRGTIQMARANGTAGSGLTRVSSFQTRLNPNGFSSSLGPGSDSESLHSSSSSLECPPSSQAPPGITRQPEPLGLSAPQATSLALKKFSSHGNVFHSEVERPIRLVSKATMNHGSLPSLDLHIAEDQSTPVPLSPTPAIYSTTAWSSSGQNSNLLLAKTSKTISREPSFSSSSSTSSSSSSLPCDTVQPPRPNLPPPATKQPMKLQKFPISLDGLMGKPLDGSDSTSSTDSTPRPLPRTQLKVSLSASPSLSQEAKEEAAAATTTTVSGVSMVPSPGRLLGMQAPESPVPLPQSPSQAASFRLVSQPQTMQVTSQPSFLRGQELALSQEAPTAPSPKRHAKPMTEKTNSSSGSKISGLQAPMPGSYPMETPNMGMTGPPEVASVPEVHSREKTKEGSSPEPGWISMEEQPLQAAQEGAPHDVPGKVGRELFGYVGIEAVLDQMRIKTMKTGFEFNIMVVGQSGLGKSTMVNTLFKSKVSCKATTPRHEERIPKTVQLQSVTHVIEEKGVKMKLTVTDTPGFGDQINNENCWDPIIKYINEQYERYLREEILISRKQKIPDTRVHSCVYFVPPTGHWLRPLDLEFMRRLSKIVNVVPVIAKADTLTLEERAEFKQRIQRDLKAHGISIYPQEDFEEDPDERILNDKIRDKIPFAVVGADQEHQVNGKRILGRKTKWGIIEGPWSCPAKALPGTSIRRGPDDSSWLPPACTPSQRLHPSIQGWGWDGCTGSSWSPQVWYTPCTAYACKQLGTH
ncbi:septin-12 isoform X1 [Alligator mississippiensis]|uniref:septin-12 isoform X1 n=1 Tax=Alligator mississippiensis TaxID=8496 RepID=UPI0028775D68|nr:septin-12 isoform X1 [Alligator mississippiensis]